MLYRQLECFLAVARLGNVSRAAEEMFLTQPTLTARLKALEEEVGDQLFVRTSRGMRLTEAGKEFVPYAERCVGSFEEGRRHLTELREASGGRLVLGASPGVGTYALPGLLERFAAAYPKVSVSVRTGHSEDI
ncbi:MAG: LysR family transcriptional regulator, partial [Rubrobacter sp.]|nr:LysR family transcriptional regulator [Rubrobacter sp.]